MISKCPCQAPRGRSILVAELDVLNSPAFRLVGYYRPSMGCFCIGRRQSADSPRPAKASGRPEPESFKRLQATGLLNGEEVLIRAALQRSTDLVGSKSAEAGSLLRCELDDVTHHFSGGGSEGLEQEGSASSAAPLLAEAAIPAVGTDPSGKASSGSSNPEAAGAGSHQTDEKADDQGQLPAKGYIQVAAAYEAPGREGDEQVVAAGSACSKRTSQQEHHITPADEGSQAELLSADHPSHFSLKQPRFSRLSSLLSDCTNGTMADSGERHSKEQPQEQQQQHTDIHQIVQQPKVCPWIGGPWRGCNVCAIGAAVSRARPRHASSDVHAMSLWCTGPAAFAHF